MASSASKIENDLFPEDSAVLVWYPSFGADERNREAWAWLPGSIVNQCCPDEWCVLVEVDALGEPDPDDPDHLLYPLCFRAAVTSDARYSAVP